MASIPSGRRDRGHAALLPPLKVPGDDVDLAALAANPAVQSFVVRAEKARTGFSLHAGNAGAVANIVRRLEGLPLAIELAAARVRSLTPGAHRRRTR